MKKIKMLLTIIFLLPLMISCWDNNELTTIFLVSGIALDKSEEEGKIDLTIQVLNLQNTEDKDKTKHSDVIILKATSTTIGEGFQTINKSTNRKLYMQHNQVLLIGEDLAREGLMEILDSFLRDLHARMAVLLFVSKDKAGDVLDAKIEHSKISGIFLSEIFNHHSNVSLKHRVRMIDFVSVLIDNTTAPMIPYIELKEKDEKEDIKEIIINGMAVFKEDKMIFNIDDHETMAYTWSMGTVHNCALVIDDEKGKAVFGIRGLTTKRKISYDNNQFKVNLDINALLRLDEVMDFKIYNIEELLNVIMELAKEEIKNRINNLYNLTKLTSSDIFQFGTYYYKFHPKKWKLIEDNWESIYKEIDLNINVNIEIHELGKVIKNLEMERKNA